MLLYFTSEPHSPYCNSFVLSFQKLYRWRKNLKEPESGILFPGITRPDADEGIICCVKYLCNKFFFHFGWEVKYIVVMFVKFPMSNKFVVEMLDHIHTSFFPPDPGAENQGQCLCVFQFSN